MKCKMQLPVLGLSWC